jgi:hypothetical protein
MREIQFPKSNVVFRIKDEFTKEMIADKIREFLVSQDSVTKFEAQPVELLAEMGVLVSGGDLDALSIEDIAEAAGIQFAGKPGDVKVTGCGTVVVLVAIILLASAEPLG